MNGTRTRTRVGAGESVADDSTVRAFEARLRAHHRLQKSRNVSGPHHRTRQIYRTGRWQSRRGVMRGAPCRYKGHRVRVHGIGDTRDYLQCTGPTELRKLIAADMDRGQLPPVPSHQLRW